MLVGIQQLAPRGLHQLNERLVDRDRLPQRHGVGAVGDEVGILQLGLQRQWHTEHDVSLTAQARDQRLKRSQQSDKQRAALTCR